MFYKLSVVVASKMGAISESQHAGRNGVAVADGRQARCGDLGNSPLVVPTILVSFRFVSIMGYRFILCVSCSGPASVAARSKAWVCEFESLRGHGCLSVVSVVCGEVEVSATG